jgi:hypothetical protein
MDGRDLNRNYGKDLDEINLTRFRQIAQPENSFIIALNDFLNQFRFRLRQSHLTDFQIPAFIIISSAAALVVNLLGSSSDSATNTEKILAVIGLTATILTSLNGSHSDRHYRKMARASDYVKAWTSEPLTTLVRRLREYKEPIIDDFVDNYHNPKDFDKLRNSLADLKSTPARISELSALQSRILKDLHEPKNKEIKQAFDEVLNFFEAMGQDVKLAIVDSDYLKEYFYSAVMNNYQLARKYIEHTEYRLGSRATWCNLVYLAQTWEKENVPPVIPRVCIRPLVLTEHDIEDCNVKQPHLLDQLGWHPAPGARS